MPTRKRIAYALLIAVVSTFVLGGFMLSYIEVRRDVDERYDELTKTPEPYTFELPVYFAFDGGNGTFRLGSLNETDFAILFKFTYPNGTLVANAPLLINSTMVVDKVVETLDRVTVVFPNSLLYPVTYGKNLLPYQGILTYRNPFLIQGGNNSFTNMFVEENAFIIFPIEGDYSPRIHFYFRDNTTKDFRDIDISLHVYPREQLTQIDTQRVSLSASQASLRLSEAVLVLGFVSVIALIVQVLDHSETKCEYTKKATNANDNNPNINKPKNHRFRRFKKKQH